MRTAAQWTAILDDLGVRPVTVTRWADVFADEVKASTFSTGDDDLVEFLKWTNGVNTEKWPPNIEG